MQNENGAEERIRCDSLGKVHFDEHQMTPDHTGQIVISMSPDKQHADAHLGFLQERHTYDVRLVIPKYLGDSVSLDKINPNVSLQSVKADQAKSKHVLKVQLFAYKSGLLNEELSIVCGDGQPFELTMSARVLGKGKGTPLLKSGIHCTGVEQDDTSDQSEPGDHTHSSKSK